MPISDQPATRTAAGISYRRLGGGPPVLLLHGIPGSAATWDSVAADLAADHDVIVVELLGFGASARPADIDRLHAQGQSTALAEMLQQLDSGPVHVVGHDFGGPTAVALHARAPQAVASLGLLATNVFTDTPIPFPLSTATWPGIGPVARRVLFSGPSQAMMLRQGVGTSGVSLDRGAHLGDAAQQRAVATIFGESLERIAELYAPIQDELPRIGVPRFVAWGDKDPFFPLDQGQRVADALGVPLQLLSGAGHFLPQERPGEVAAMVRAVLARASGG